MLLPFLTVSFHLYLRYALATILVGLSLWHLAYTLHDNYFLDREIAEMTASVNQIEENSTLVLCLDKPGQKYSPALGPIKYVHPYLHVGSYYCLNSRVALLQNYEATYDYFPVNYRYQMEDRPYSGPKTSYPESADYVLAWRDDSHRHRRIAAGDTGPRLSTYPYRRRLHFVLVGSSLAKLFW
jgi:hypothetical protein